MGTSWNISQVLIFTLEGSQCAGGDWEMSMSNPSSRTDFGRKRARSKSQMLKDNVSTIIEVLFPQFIKYPVPVAMSAILASGFGVGMLGWRLNPSVSFHK